MDANRSRRVLWGSILNIFDDAAYLNDRRVLHGGASRGIKELLDAIGVGECTLVNHDFGDPIGLTMMRLFPGLNVRELVFSDKNLFTDSYVPPLRVAEIPLVYTVFFSWW